MKKIKVFDVRVDEQPALQRWIEQHKDEVEVVLTEDSLGGEHLSQLEDIDGITISQMTKVDPNYFKVLADNGIHHIAQRSAGFDMYDLPAANEAGIKISNVPSYSPQSIAEFAVTRTLALVRHTDRIDRNVAVQDFTWDLEVQGRTIESLKVGVLGTGRIGSRAAKIFNGFGAEVVAYDLAPNPELENVLTYVDSLEELVKDIDVLTIHIPGSPENKYVVNEAVLSHAKPGLLVINTARGVVLDTEALIRKLDDGTVAAAAIDTYENEGPYFTHDWTNKPLEDPILSHLLERDEVLISPHVAFYTDEAVQNLVDIPLDDVLSYINTQTADHIVNP
ncbi:MULTISPECIES: D-2-hydroxyacid dehydrogenase [unclassified Staphylococcus]|uniref:D-2-hydroxyacid dehydrogenase n=1 Tax=unclassified Staphylococcus TaxID=91994 RepID=UPI0021D03CFD|nr:MULTISPECIES: D-2-hydroxyacid dehydrogenase [unclassified Staphylococcus]UXR70033.1 D-2-hydroxyacid dehydrogenase [Staphylococcus sp. IVB6246]UXR72091.1 D-2-hydroxyacid dehydrogenase [Staphylococcus sp. IVB6240]UXR74399.1 D-2-hydroxyacid dehydrogenase [Staphylococcus sp. IVB6238]UXR76784.1 D-2-hydroxyacid dehydrogenase [Staphylococcus sp. IVB6233]